MPNSLLRKAIDAVWPRGSAWLPKVGGGLDGLLLGIADSLETARAKLSTLAAIRSPSLTEQITELELDFGIAPDPSLTDAERQGRLSARINSEQIAGTRDRMERELQAAGFDLFVYANNPAVDPLQFASGSLMVAGGVTAFAGEPEAVAGSGAIDPLVNGAFFSTEAVWRTMAGGTEAFAGEPEAVAEQTGTTEAVYKYDVPADPADWPLVFFVGGAATYGGSGELVTIETVQIPPARRAELEETVLRLKPLHSWAIMVVVYI